MPSRASRRTRAHAAWWRTGRLHAGCARAPRRASASGAARADGIDAIVPRPSDTRDRARSGFTVFLHKQRRDSRTRPGVSVWPLACSARIANETDESSRTPDWRPGKKTRHVLSATPEKSEARSVRAFSLLATPRRRPIEERSRTLGVTHKRHSENGLRRPRKARFFVSDASPRALHDARTRRATLPPSGRPTPVTPVLARSRRTSARTRTRTPRVRPLRE